MAEAIHEAIRTKRHALIEAGTGSGKSFGYLIPALETGKRVVISTGTIALQEQLIKKDLPFLQQALGREVPVALAKGRSNYLCDRRLSEALRLVSPGDPNYAVLEELVQLRTGEEEAPGAWEGDRAELSFGVDGRLWSEMLASDPNDCLGPRCPNWHHTPHRIARSRLEEAQVIIANHALYCTDLAMGGGLLPHHDVVVFDEAHHLERAAVGSFSIMMQKGLTGRLLQRVERRFQELPFRLNQEILTAESTLTGALMTRGYGQFRLEPEELPGEVELLAVLTRQLADWLSQQAPTQMNLQMEDPELALESAEVLRQQLISLATMYADRWEHFARLTHDPERANWMTIDPSRDYFELQSAPLSVASHLAKTLWPHRVAVLTSATLAVERRFDFLRSELGLPADTVDRVLDSPFDFPRQALLYVPRKLPYPADEGFLDGAAEEIRRILEVSEGRAFVLCTSYRAMRELSQRLVGVVPYPTRTQEEMPRTRLIEWFKQTPGAVLFATATFWEGVDVPGEALSCVIIDKLPFSCPDDPVIQGKVELMKSRGEDWFAGFMLPKATLTLKQGFGRLIRSRSDTGLVAILDRRLVERRYGSSILSSLPPARRVFTLPVSIPAGLRDAPAATRRDLPESPSWGGAREQGPPTDLETVLGLPPGW